MLYALVPALTGIFVKNIWNRFRPVFAYIQKIIAGLPVYFYEMQIDSREIQTRILQMTTTFPEIQNGVLQSQNGCVQKP